MDKDIRELKLKLAQTLNESEIPIEVKRLVLSEIIREVESLADRVIAEQISKGEQNAESVCENQLAE